MSVHRWGAKPPPSRLHERIYVKYGAVERPAILRNYVFANVACSVYSQKVTP